MIKINELRIRNLVKKGEEIFETDFITIKMAHNYQPIPLTEEWLLKFGFDRHHKDYFNNVILLKEIGEWDLKLYPQGEVSSAIPMNIKIKSVHQLQNLYFALTGEELTIK